MASFHSLVQLASVSLTVTLPHTAAGSPVALVNPHLYVQLYRWILVAPFQSSHQAVHWTLQKLFAISLLKSPLPPVQSADNHRRIPAAQLWCAGFFDQFRNTPSTGVKSGKMMLHPQNHSDVGLCKSVTWSCYGRWTLTTWQAAMLTWRNGKIGTSTSLSARHSLTKVIAGNSPKHKNSRVNSSTSVWPRLSP